MSASDLLTSQDDPEIPAAKTAEQIEEAIQDRFTRRPQHRTPIDRSLLPPGPSLPPQLQTLLILPLRHLVTPALVRRYGTPYTISVPPHGEPLVMFSRPEDVHEIFAGDPALFHAGEINTILRPYMGDHSVLLLDEQEHSRARRLLMPGFTGAAVRGYRERVQQVAADEVAQWRPGSTIRALDRMNAVTLEVILHVLFGVSDARRLDALRTLVNQALLMNPLLLLTLDLPRLHRFGPWQRQLEIARQLDELIYAEIAEHRRAPDLHERSDLLSRLIRASSEDDEALTDAELRDELITLVLAGHETTAVTLSWALYELGRHPELSLRTVRAVREGDDAWLEAVFKETLRRRPVLPMLIRVLSRDATVGGHDLPAGTAVGVSITTAHTSQSAYPDAEEFRPDRFLTDPPPANTWIPFGGGARRCIGATFAQMEGVELLRAIYSEVEVRSLGRELPRVRNLASVPSRRARVEVRAARRG